MVSDSTESTSNPSTIHAFYLSFQEEQAILDSLIDNLSTVPASERPAAIDDYLLRINHLSDRVKDAASYLPPYDQRKYSEHIKALSDNFSHARKALAPKQKFSFKSKAKPISSSKPPTPSNSTKPTPTPTLSLALPALTTQNHISITSLTSQYICPLPLPQSSPVSLSSLRSCFIDLSPSSNSSPPSMLAVKDITTSILFAPHISGPSHLTSIRNSILILNSAQFRMHDTHNTDVYLLCPSRPIIEDCSGIRFAPLPVEWLTNVGQVVERKNMWDQVDDFKWLKAERSPNWSIMPEGDSVRGCVWKEVMETVGKAASEAKDGGDGVQRVEMDVEKILGMMKKREETS